MTQKILGISHITFICKDLEKTAHMLKQIFNAEELYCSGEKTFSLSPEKFFHIAGIWIAIMQGESIEKTYNHIAFQINDNDIPFYKEKITSLGLEILPDRERHASEANSLYFYDYDNHLFELHSGNLNTRLAYYHSKNISFNKATLKHKEIIFSWLNEPHIQEFWDNTQAHKDDIVNFMQGRVTASSYANGEYVYWIGSIDNIPYCMIMTIEEKPEQARPKIKNDHLSKTGSTYSLDFMIGNKNYVGKGLGAKTLTEFLVFFKNSIDPNADTFFIDPDITNPKAKHVYENAGFKFIGDFIMEGDGCFAGQKTYFLVKKI